MTIIEMKTEVVISNNDELLLLYRCACLSASYVGENVIFYYFFILTSSVFSHVNNMTMDVNDSLSLWSITFCVDIQEDEPAHRSSYCDLKLHFIVK